jgi:hypothetical protein
MSRLYLYLASRSKDGIKLVATMNGDKEVNSKVESIESLKLPQSWESQVKQIAKNYRMSYELRIESCPSFVELKQRLHKRGYKSLPIGASPLLRLDDQGKLPLANTSECKVVRTMMQKRKV